MSARIIAESCTDSDLHPAVRGSEHPSVAELIRDSIELWFGQRHPDDEVRETISARSLDEMLCRIADRSYNVGLADSEPEPAYPDDDAETSLYRLDAILNGIDALARDRDYQFDSESVQRLISMARELVAHLLPAGADEP